MPERARPLADGRARPQGAAASAAPASRFASRETRRQQLVDATIASIAELGLSETTLASVTRRAGLSHGTVNFHFKSKRGLLVETLRHLTGEHRARWRAALEERAAGPAGRLVAMIAVDFDPAICNASRLAVWFAFWGERSCGPLYREACGEVDAERLAAFERLCAEITEEGGYAELDAARAARCLQSLVDGIWLNMLYQPGQHTNEEAMAMCLSFLAGQFPRHFPEPSA
ncbi:MAG TPA: transcriptional regulator BetI [Thermohalobaculum sp.]|nr:transcriptional regulator BetI [Thermohalobaculum sp.]